MKTVFENSNIVPNQMLRPANPIRGAGYREVAAAFYKEFPIGTELTVAEFDGFIIDHAGVEPPSNTETGSEGWLAFLQRRHQTKSNINKAACHPDIEHHGALPFFLKQNGNNRLSVVTPYDAATKAGDNSVMHQLTTLTKTKQRRLQHLIQSIDFATLPMGEQVKVAMLADHISDFEVRIEREINDLDAKFNKVRSGILTLVHTGQITPQNGGIKALENLTDEEDED